MNTRSKMRHAIVVIIVAIAPNAILACLGKTTSVPSDSAIAAVSEGGPQDAVAESACIVRYQDVCDCCPVKAKPFDESGGCKRPEFLWQCKTPGADGYCLNANETPECYIRRLA